MKKKISIVKSRVKGIITIAFILATAAGLWAAGLVQDAAIPEQNKAEWVEVKAALQADLNVCREHCGGATECLNNCAGAFQARLEKEFRRLMSGPRPVYAGNDMAEYPACPYCGMNREKFAHSRVLVIYSDKSVFAGCSLHCAAVDLAIHLDKSPETILVGDFKTRKLIDAERAYWVVGGKQPGVMTGQAKWAFENRNDAAQYIRENGGDWAVFETAVQAAYESMHRDTNMIRLRRAEKRKAATKTGG